MMKKNLLLLAAALATSIAWSAPIITNTTVWHDTAFAGPYVVSSVIHDPSSTLTDTLIRYAYNPAPGDNPAGWGTFAGPDSARGDTMYFHVPAIPMGLETPVRVGYALWARNAVYDETSDPGIEYYSFVNTVYSPRFSNVSSLYDTFYSGPLIVRANVTTMYGDSVTGNNIYSDILGGGDYPCDSLGADGFYYYAIPRHPGNAQTPLTVFWYLAASDTMGNTASYPLKRDTINHFVLTDPKPSNVHTIASTSQTGPFAAWIDYASEGAVTRDSLWIFNGSDYAPFPRDSVGTGNPLRYYYTIPQQNQPVVSPVSVYWYLKAVDSASGNYVYLPNSGPSTPYSFYIYDRTPPSLGAVSAFDNNAAPGSRTVYASAHDTSGIYQMRLYFRTRPDADTTWQYLPMYPTGVQNQYKATLPYASAGTLVQYYVSAIDGAVDEGGIRLRNTSFFPAGGAATPWQFFIGDQPHRLLLVNDALASNDYAGFYLSCLDTTGVLYGYWDNRSATVLPSLHNFNTLIWFTGDDSTTTLGQTDRDSLAAFLDRGGDLLLSSKNLGQNIGDTSVLMTNYFKIHLAGTNVSLANLILPGRASFPISYGPTDTVRLTTSGTAGNYRSVDRYLPLAGADSVYTFKTVGGCGVVRCSTATYRTVFSSLPLECVGKQTAHNVSRTYFIARCLRWFGMTAFYKVDDGLKPPGGEYSFKLSPASPNPFAQATAIGYQLAAPGKVSLKVYNVAGQLVRTLVDQSLPAGKYSVSWNGTGDGGGRVTNGIYFYRLSDGRQELTRRLLIIK